MNPERLKEAVNCLYCNESKGFPWASENGFTAVKCARCGLIYVNPRPALSLISEAVQTGVHRDVDHGRTAIAKHSTAKVRRYKKVLAQTFADVWLNAEKTISWIDVGAGYGELIESISQLAPKGSKIVGLEPMKPKVDHARRRGLMMRQCYLNEVNEKFDFLSLINVYSHIPDFRAFLRDVKEVLNVHGEILLETGNTADLKSRNEVPGDLDLPDHLVFAGEKHLTGYLQEAGFGIVSIKRTRVDNLVRFLKNVVKKLMGRKNINIRLPFTSPYRSLLIRARLD